MRTWYALEKEQRLRKDQLGSYRRKEGMFGWLSAQRDHLKQGGVGWCELQNLSIRILNQGASPSPCEQLWTEFTFVASKKRNQLGAAKTNDLVFVHSNLKLLLKYREELKVEYIGWENHSSLSSTSDGANDLEDEAQTCPSLEQMAFSYLTAVYLNLAAYNIVVSESFFSTFPAYNAAVFSVSFAA